MMNRRIMPALPERVMITFYGSGRIHYNQYVMEYCEDEDDCFTNFESAFPAIVLDNTITAREALSWEPTVSPLNDNEIDFRISFDESDDED
ncbi:hypothetical protein Tco_0777829 [Tanacetum coccineum]